MDKVVAYIPILHIVAAVFAVIELGLTAYSKSMTPYRPRHSPLQTTTDNPSQL